MEENKQVEQVETEKEVEGKPTKKKVEKKPTKKVRWKLDPDNSIIFVSKEESELAEAEARFKFKLVVYKDSDTHVESMKITNFVVDRATVQAGEWEAAEGTENGSIVTSIVDLPQDIKKFKRFGVVIGDTYFRDLARRIEEEYANIEVGTVTLSMGDTRYSDLIEEVKRYFEEYKENDYITADFCNIPVNVFNGLAFDCGYNEYEMRNLRSQLAQDKYIHVVSGRYAILKRMGSKPERVIAFYREKLGIDMPVKQDKRKKVKDDGDE